MKKFLIVDDVKGWRDFNSNAAYSLLGENIQIITAASAREGYDQLLQNNDSPFDVIMTDLQMEDDFAPKYAGEWFVEQIKTFKRYKQTKVIMISAAYNIRTIASNLDVECIPKSTAAKCLSAYEELLLR